MFLRKTHVSPHPPRVAPCALLKEDKERDMTVLKRKRLLRLEEHAHIYIYGVREAAWLRRLPADDGATMEAEVTDVPTRWHQHAGVRQCKEMARTQR